MSYINKARKKIMILLSKKKWKTDNGANNFSQLQHNKVYIRDGTCSKRVYVIALGTSYASIRNNYI